MASFSWTTGEVSLKLRHKNAMHTQKSTGSVPAALLFDVLRDLLEFHLDLFQLPFGIALLELCLSKADLKRITFAETVCGRG